MKYTIRFSPFAKEDKLEIKTYLSKFYPRTHKRFTALLKNKINNLKDIYPEYSENNNYRRFFVKNYIIFYKVNEKEKQIEIYRILRASWNLPEHLPPK